MVAAGVLSDETPMIIEMIVAHDVSIEQSTESDLNYGVSDGTSFAGFRTPDENGYGNRAPCFGVQASSGANLTNHMKTDGKGLTARIVSFLRSSSSLLSYRGITHWAGVYCTGRGLHQDRTLQYSTDDQPRPYS